MSALVSQSVNPATVVGAGVNPWPIKTLLVDDSSFDRHRMTRLCQSTDLNLEITEIAGMSDLDEALHSDIFDLVFLDHNLADGTGLGALKSVYDDPKHTLAATIMITGDGNTSVAVEAMKNGCTDYIEKSSLTAATIQRAVQNALEISCLKQDVSDARDFNDRMVQVLDRFAQECVSDMKPILSQMMRQADMQHNAAGEGIDTATDSTHELQQSCQKLWNFLEKIERYPTTLNKH